MAKTPTNATLSPGVFTPGNYIREEDVQTVQEALNYAFQESMRQHLYVLAGDDGWATNAVATHEAPIPTTSGATVLYRWQQWIDADQEFVDVGFSVTIAGADQVDVDFDIGGVTNSTFNLTSGTASASETLDVSGLSGLVSCTCTVDHSSGSATLVPDWWFCQERNQPTIPSPPDE